jgi:chromosome segregation ATPase
MQTAALEEALAASEAARERMEAAFQHELARAQDAAVAAEEALQHASAAAADEAARARREAASASSALRGRCDALEKQLASLSADSAAQQARATEAAAAAAAQLAEVSAEFAQFRRIALTVAEARDKDLAALRDELAAMRGGAADAPAATSRAPSAAEAALLEAESRKLVELASLQASRDGAFGGVTLRAQHAEEALASALAKCAVLESECSALSERLAELSRSESRVSTDLTYLKNVCLKLLGASEADEEQALSLVVGTLLCFSPQEMAAVGAAVEARRAKLERGATGGAGGYLGSLLGYP